MCNSDLESLNHFLLQCPAYVNEGKKILKTERLNTEEEEDVIGDLLFKEELIEKTKTVLNEMWKKREMKRKTLDTTS